MNWQPIHTAPKDGTVLLVCWLGQIKLAWWEPDLHNWQEYPDGDFEDIRGEELTHWMLLSELPK